MAERDYQLTVQKKAIRRIHIYVYPSQNCVRVTAPKDISDAKIAEFLRKRKHGYKSICAVRRKKRRV